MNIQLKKMLVIIVMVALVLVSGTPYLGSAEENDKKQSDQAATTQDNKTKDETKPKVELTAVSATKKIAENGRLQLYIDENNGQIRVVDSSTGVEWLGAPQVEKKMPPNNRNFIESPVHIRFTEGVSTTQTYPLKEKGTKITAKPIENGVRVEFDITAIKLSFAIEYRLLDNAIEATVPFDSIQEKGSVRLTSLELLPFFGAATGQDDGAVFMPDGSGALMRFKENHPVYFDIYSQYVYGGDHAFVKKVNEQVKKYIRKGPSIKEFAALPVFGIYKNGQGIMGIITEGDYDTLINATPSGLRNIQLYRTSAEYVYRNDDIIFIGNSGEIPLFQGNIIKGDRTTRYVLLQGDKANYVGMAHAYRDYLINEKKLQPIMQKDIPFQLRLFGGVLRDEIIGSTFIDMTSFEQARKIIDEFIAKGITSIEITYDGWSDDGIFGNQPSHFPVEGKLGGKNELKKLAAYAKEKGISLYLKANYVRPFEDSDPVWAYKDAIRGINRDVMPIYNYWVSDRFNNFRQLFYLLKPARVFDKYIVKEADKFADLGIGGVHLKHMGDTLYSDQDPKTLTSREFTADIWVKTLKLMKEKVGKTAVDYGFAYTLQHIDRIDDIPMDSSHFTYQDTAVPFYQIAVHGIIPYTAKPSNLRDDPKLEFLRMLEYGAMPTYELTYESTSKLQRTMMDRLFSSKYSYWLEPSIEEYKQVIDIYNKVADQAIVNHEQLDKRLYRTTYANGLQVIVNYDSKVARVGDSLVQAYDYTVVEGGK
jgi:hypothetical protein